MEKKKKKKKISLVDIEIPIEGVSNVKTVTPENLGPRVKVTES